MDMTSGFAATGLYSDARDHAPAAVALTAVLEQLPSASAALFAAPPDAAADLNKPQLISINRLTPDTRGSEPTSRGSGPPSRGSEPTSTGGQGAQGRAYEAPKQGQTRWSGDTRAHQFHSATAVLVTTPIQERSDYSLLSELSLPGSGSPISVTQQGLSQSLSAYDNPLLEQPPGRQDTNGITIGITKFDEIAHAAAHAGDVRMRDMRDGLAANPAAAANHATATGRLSLTHQNTEEPSAQAGSHFWRRNKSLQQAGGASFASRSRKGYGRSQTMLRVNPLAGTASGDSGMPEAPWGAESLGSGAIWSQHPEDWTLGDSRGPVASKSGIPVKHTRSQARGRVQAAMRGAPKLR